MEISVILCTYNRAESLRRTLEGFTRLNVPPGLRWELILVDNNSSDHTKAVCESFNRRLPIRYFFEPCPGQSAARNRGIVEAAGALLLFTDDDVDVDPDWMKVYRDAAARHPAAAFFGGRIIPRWERTPPRWLEQNSRTFLACIALNLDMGDAEFELADPTYPFAGANLVFRKETFEKAGVLFRKDLGLKGNEQVRFEDTFLIRQVMARGLPGVYIPTAIVYHRNPPERMTKRYLREWFKAAGVAAVRLGELPPSDHVWFGVPRYLWAQFLRNALGFGVTRWTTSSRIWLRYQTRMISKWGSICEFRKTQGGANR